MRAAAGMLAVASDMRSGMVAAGLLAAARKSPTDARRATMQLVCQAFIARYSPMASVRRLFAWSCGRWVSILGRILRFKCGERYVKRFTKTSAIFATSRQPLSEVSAGPRRGSSTRLVTACLFRLCCS